MNLHKIPLNGLGPGPMKNARQQAEEREAKRVRAKSKPDTRAEGAK